MSPLPSPYSSAPAQGSSFPHVRRYPTVHLILSVRRARPGRIPGYVWRRSTPESLGGVGGPSYPPGIRGPHRTGGGRDRAASDPGSRGECSDRGGGGLRSSHGPVEAAEPGHCAGPSEGEKDGDPLSPPWRLVPRLSPSSREIRAPTRSSWASTGSAGPSPIEGQPGRRASGPRKPSRPITGSWSCGRVPTTSVRPCIASSEGRCIPGLPNGMVMRSGSAVRSNHHGRTPDGNRVSRHAPTALLRLPGPPRLRPSPDIPGPPPHGP
jgi:hypothetical protein